MRYPHRTLSASRFPVLALAVIAFLPLAPASTAFAQAGAEAAAQAKHAADWAKRQRESGNTGIVPSSSPTSTGNPGVAKRVPGRAPEPIRIPRPISGAPGTVAGIVREKGSGAPLRGAILSLTSTEPQYVIERSLARTDSLGRYSFPGVEPGRWALAIVKDQLPATYSTREADRVVVVAKTQSVEALPFLVSRTACVQGHVTWKDGYIFSDAPVLIAPMDSSLGVAEGRVNGVGDFQICSAPADSVMVWLMLRDGRRLGAPVRLTVGESRSLDFLPEPVDQMGGAVVQVQALSTSRAPVPGAEVVVVGRQVVSAGRPSMTVFTQVAHADRGGLAQLRLPYGTYEILVSNPREGQWHRVEQFVLADGAPAIVPQEVVLRGSSTAEQRKEWRDGLLARGDNFLKMWRP